MQKILRKNINTGKAPERHSPDGSVNVLLVVYNPDMYSKDGSNSYLPPWGVSNAAYYNLHQDQFLGWIDLEDLQWDKYK